MNIGFLSGMLVLLALSLPRSSAAAAEPTSVQQDLQQFVSTVQGKLRQAKQSPSDLAPELSKLDELLATHGPQKHPDVARVLLMKALLLAQVLDEQEQAKSLLQQLKRDYPETEPAKYCEQILASLTDLATARNIQRQLTEGATFPGFDVRDLDGHPLSLATYRGKTVLIHFWSMRYPQCVPELSEVLKAYEKFHPKGLEILGVNLDEDKQQTAIYVKDRRMVWPQFCDGKGWQNELAVAYGVYSLPFNYLLDPRGRILGKDLRGEALQDSIRKALAAE